MGAARAYLRALDLAQDLALAAVNSREDAESLIRTPAWDRRWWDAESAAREGLQERAEAALGRQSVLEQLSELAARHNDSVHAAARRHLGEEAALARAAAGAVALALHEYALARLAGAGESHLFVRKYALFARGRWPLGVVHDTFHLY